MTDITSGPRDRRGVGDGQADPAGAGGAEQLMGEQPGRAYLRGFSGVAFVVTCAVLAPILSATIPFMLLLPLGLWRASQPVFWAEMFQIWLTFSGTWALMGIVPGVVAGLVLVRRLWRGGRLYYATVARCTAICSAFSFPLAWLMLQFAACIGWTSAICSAAEASGWLFPLYSIATVIVTVPCGLGSATLLWWGWGVIFGRSLDIPVTAGPAPVMQGSDVSA